MGRVEEREPNQGAFIFDELTDLVEEAVLKEFEAIAARGGVLGHGNRLPARQDPGGVALLRAPKHDGSYPIIGVNTF